MMIGQVGIRNDLNMVVRYYFDAKEDYRLAARRATDPELHAVLDNECRLREQYHLQLQEAETRLGVDMSDNGNVGADFKRDWERIRGAIIGHGLEAALRLAHASDTHAVQQIEALMSLDLNPSIDAVLKTHLPHLRDSIVKINETLSSPGKQNA